MLHQVSQSAGSPNEAPVLYSIPVQPTPASQQWRGDSTTIFSACVSVVQPGGCADTSVDSVEKKPRLEALVQHLAGHLAYLSESAAAEVEVLMDYCSGITAI